MHCVTLQLVQGDDQNGDQHFRNCCGVNSIIELIMNHNNITQILHSIHRPITATVTEI